MLRLIASTLLLVLLAACSTPSGRGADPMSATTEPPKTEATCAARGGTWTQLGRAPVKQCLLRTTDAGKACTDNRQCEGLCLAAEGTPDGPATGGTCSVDTNVFGCRTRLQDGRASTLCVD